MIAAVCSAFPGVRHVATAVAMADVVIAVNSAAAHVDHDWLAAGDQRTLARLPVSARPRVGVLTMAHEIPKFQHDPTWQGVRWLAWQDLKFWPDAIQTSPLNWSIQTALLLAAELADTIALYETVLGRPDPETTADCLAYPGVNRGPERWAKERRELQGTLDVLATHSNHIIHPLRGHHP